VCVDAGPTAASRRVAARGGGGRGPGHVPDRRCFSTLPGPGHSRPTRCPATVPSSGGSEHPGGGTRDTPERPGGLGR
jgi:hypothetical protein